MGRRVKYAFGADPGINHLAWEIVGTDGSVTAGVIRNTYKPAKGEKKSKLGWNKLRRLLPLIEEELGRARAGFPRLEAWVCEGQYPGIGNPDHQTRNGWVSSLVWGFGQGVAPRYIAIPQEWTRGRPKELRHHELSKHIRPESTWIWIGPKPPNGIMHDVRDAVGLALWGLKQREIHV